MASQAGREACHCIPFETVIPAHCIKLLPILVTAAALGCGEDVQQATAPEPPAALDAIQYFV